ncbi:ABC transporter ATP-binding protein [Methanococcoides sp. SA1]|nr:ABC transporter ATP-binding protein [Methanococcoides sp. SA1]
MSPLLKVEDLCKSYDHVKVFENVNFSVDKGETLGLFGRSGSGKTTIGRCIVDIEVPDSGEIFFEGESILSMNRQGMARIRPKLQMLFQHPETSLDPRMKGMDSIVEPLKLHTNLSMDQIMEKVDDLIELVGLRREHLARYPGQLSGGEIQRIVLARIISIGPSFIVADEATSMLDVSVQAQILRLMERIQEETSVSYLLISHDIDVLKNVCDRIAYLENGTITRIERV